jgi:hypothetical protein
MQFVIIYELLVCGCSMIKTKIWSPYSSCWKSKVFP